MDLASSCDLSGKVAVLTGGAGVLCSTMARALVACGARVAVLDINLEGAERVNAWLPDCGKVAARR